MRRFFIFVTSHPLPILGTAAVLAGILGFHILSIRRDTSPDAFIPPGHPALRLYHRVQDDFGLIEPIAVAVIRDAEGGIFESSTLELIRNLTGQIQDLPGVEPGDVMSLATESGVFFDEDGSPGYERLMKAVPREDEGIVRLRQEVMGYELYRGTLVAEDGSAAMILIRPHDERQADTAYRALRDLIEHAEVTDQHLVVAGEAAVRAHMGKAVSDDALRMNFVCPTVMMVLIILAYRTGRGTVLPMCVIGGASALALGSMSVADVPVYIVTNGIFVIIMALGVADSLHLLGQYYEEQLDTRGRSRQQIIVDACMALWFPVLVTSLTDVAGFFSLYWAGGMPPIEYFGLFTCLGVIGALVYSYTVVPAGLAILPLKESRAFTRRHKAQDDTGGLDAIGRAMAWIGQTVYQRRVLTAVCSLFVLVAAGKGASSLVINDARILAFKDDHPIRQATKEINRRFDGTSYLNIVVEADEREAMLLPDVLHRIDALEAFTESLPRVGGTHSIAGWVKRAHQKLNEDAPEYYAIPEDPEDSRFYLDSLGAQTCPMSRSLREVVDPTYTRTNLIIRMKSSEFIHQREAIGRLEAYLAESFTGPSLTATIAGRANLDYHWLEMIRSTHLRSVGFSMGCVLLLTGLMFRSVIGGLLCALVVGSAVLVNYAVMGWAGIPLGVGTSMFASIAIGAGVNFPIHLLDRLRVNMRKADARPADVFSQSLAFTGRALFFTAFVVAVGFLLLMVSQFQTLVRFGLLIGLGMIVSFAASITLLPALVALWKPSFIYGKPVPDHDR